MYNEGLILKPFGLGYTFEEDYAYSTIESESYKYNEVIERMKKRINEVKNSPIDEVEFENIKKALYGDFVRLFNSVSGIATTFISNYFRGIDTSDYAKGYKDITLKDVEDIIKEHFDFEKMAVSIIENKKESDK